MGHLHIRYAGLLCGIVSLAAACEPGADGKPETTSEPESIISNAAPAWWTAAKARFGHRVAAHDAGFRTQTTAAGAGYVRGLPGTEIVVPAEASGRMVISHHATSSALEITRIGAGDAVGEWVDGALLHTRGGPLGSHLIVRPTSEGSEDLFLFEAAPSTAAVELGVGVAALGGLRAVLGGLEFLDRGGVARMRLRAPVVIDADGETHAATLRVVDCPVDRDPRPATGRSFVGLDGAERCTLSLSWPDGLRAPLLVDPQWEPAALLNVARTHHGATLLSNGDVLVAGGYDQTGAGVAELEVFCPEDNCPGGAAFSLVGTTLATPRGSHTQSLAGTGPDRVLIAGGRTGLASPSGLATAELFDVSTGLVTAAGSMASARHGHTATVVGSPPSVLIAGGSGNATAELFTLGSGFAPPIAMIAQRRGHVAEVTGNGRVLIAGGIGSLGFALSSAELFDAAAGTFTATGSMTSPRAFATATQQEDALGTVLVVGGTNGAGFYYKTADVFIPSGAGSFQQQTIAMQRERAFHAATKLAGEATVLITGGTDGNTVLANTEIFVLGAPSSALASTMDRPRNFHAALALQSNRPVVIGGGLTGTPAAPESGSMLLQSAISAEILLRSNGDACNAHGECASGICYDLAAGTGVCCSDSCSDPCRSCRPEQTADPTDPGGECLIVNDGEQVLEQCQSNVELALICVGGQITASQVQPCAPYVCSTAQCHTSCSSDAQCDADSFCEKPTPLPGNCVAKRARGEACVGANQCESGHCVDAICCESACDGQCEACDLTGSEGDCSQVSGAPRGDRPPCEGAGTPCEGSCIDNPSVCTYEPVACGDSSCTDGVRTGGRCDVGNPGTCAPVTEECGAFACDSTATSCLAVCSKTEECAQGAVCRESLCAFVESAECDGDHTVVEPNGSLTDCSPFRCDGAACLNRCKIVDDCVDGKVCDQSGACVDPPPAPEPVEDCSFASPTGGKVNLLYFLALAGLASLSRRRGGSR